MNFKNNIEVVLDSVNQALIRSNRRFKDLSILVVSKTKSKEEILKLYNLGFRNFAENRIKELNEKSLVLPKDIIWHFIGRLQSNKLKEVILNSSYIHSVDSLEKAKHIADLQKILHRNIGVFLQVNISGENTKAGFTEAFLRENIGELLSLDLKIEGLMTMAPNTEDLELIRKCFRDCSVLQKEIFPKSKSLSMGMSNDFEIAIEEGATILRLGSILFQ